MKKIILFCLLFSCCLYGETRYVKAGSSNPVPPYTSWATASDSIGKCIAYSNEGDTIQLSEGIFIETIDMKRRMVLQGAGKFKTTISAGNLQRPTPQRYWIVSLGDSNTINNLRIKGNANLLVGVNTLYASPSSFHFSIIENIVFDSLESAVSLNEGIIRNSNARVTLNFLFINNPAFNSSVLVENNNVICEDFVTTYQSPFRPAGASKIIIRNNMVVFSSNDMAVTDDLLGPPGQTFDIYNNDFMIFNAIGSSVFLYKEYLFTNNTFHCRQFAPSGIITPRAVFEINNQASFINNIFSNLGKLFSPMSVPIQSFQYNVIWRGEGLLFMDSTNIFEYPMFTDITYQIFYYWPVSVSDTLFYNTKLQKYSKIIDKGSYLIADKDGSRSDPGRFGGPFGESYTYIDTAPTPPMIGELIWDETQSAYKASWMRTYDSDFARYSVFLDTITASPGGQHYFAIETQDTFTVIPMTGGRPAGLSALAVSSFDTSGNQSIWQKIAGDFVTEVKIGNSTGIDNHSITGIYPNPFNAEAKVEYVIGSKGSAIFRIYDINGALLQTIDKGEQEEGSYNITLNMPSFASGVYFIRLEVRDSYSGKITQTQSKKIVMVK